MKDRRELLALAAAILIAYFGLVAVGVWLYAINSKTVKRDAASAAAVARCLDSRPILMKFNRFISIVSVRDHILDPPVFHIPTVTECRNR